MGACGLHVQYMFAFKNRDMVLEIYRYGVESDRLPVARVHFTHDTLFQAAGLIVILRTSLKLSKNNAPQDLC